MGFPPFILFNMVFYTTSLLSVTPTLHSWINLTCSWYIFLFLKNICCWICSIFVSIFIRDIRLYYSFIVVSSSSLGIMKWPHGMSWEVFPPILFFGRVCEGLVVIRLKIFGIIR